MQNIQRRTCPAPAQLPAVLRCGDMNAMSQCKHLCHSGKVPSAPSHMARLAAASACAYLPSSCAMRVLAPNAVLCLYLLALDKGGQLLAVFSQGVVGLLTTCACYWQWCFTL